MSTLQNFQTIIKNNPDLTTHGFGIDKGYNYSFATERQNINNYFEEFRISCAYLATGPKINKKLTSYGWKHEVEHYAKEHGLKPDYIPEGAFVAAVIAEGVPYKCVKGTTHITLK